jgi:hypothetical protein
VKRRLALAVLVAGSLPATAQEIGGRYLVDGQGFDGKPYRGEAEIVLTTDVHCTINWQTGGSTSQGICMRSGDVFSAAFVLEGRVGMLIYTVQKDGALNGFWTMSGSDGVGYENLAPMRQ